MSPTPSALLENPMVLSFVFHPRSDGPWVSLPEGSEILKFPARDGVAMNVRFHPAAPDGPHVLLFHGNGEIASDYDDLAQGFLNIGFSLLACDYRGYGSNEGTPTGSNLLTDAVDTFDAVSGWLKDNGRPGPLYVMGRSLGTASALEIGVRRQEAIAGLMFDSAFCDTVALLARIGFPVDQLGLREEDGFQNREKITRIRKPVLFMHGQNDTITPLGDATDLHAICPAKKRHLVMIPGATHNDTFLRAGALYFQTIENFTGRSRKYGRKKRES